MKAALKILSIFCLLILCISCSKTEIDKIDETIHLSYKGAEMPAYVHGDPSDNTYLLVLHGAGSFGLSFRDGLFTKELEEKYVVVYFDQRGQSMSEGNYQKPNDVINLMAEDVDMLTKVLKKRYGSDINLFILGHSLGGMISGSSLLNHDQYQYKGWINVDGLMDTPSVSNARKELIVNIAQQQASKDSKLKSEWNTLDSDASKATDYDEILNLAARTINLLKKDEVVKQSPSSAKRLQAIVANNPINWLVANFFNQPAKQAISSQFSLLDKIQNIDIPTLWIYGNYDVSVPPSTGQTAFDRIRTQDKQFYSFNESIHHPHDTEPDLFAELLIEFIERYK